MNPNFFLFSFFAQQHVYDVARNHEISDLIILVFPHLDRTSNSIHMRRLILFIIINIGDFYSAQAENLCSQTLLYYTLKHHNYFQINNGTIK